MPSTPATEVWPSARIARLALAEGNVAHATNAYRQTIATFTAAGERWHADDARAEALAAGLAVQLD